VTPFFWSSTPRADNKPTWVQVDLAGIHKIEEVHLYPRDDKGNEGLGFSINFDVQVSRDGKNWKTLTSKTNEPKTKDVRIIKFKPVNTRYVRIVGTKLQAIPREKTYCMQLVELEVY